MTIKIMADSASDLTTEHYNEYDIEMVPLTVNLDGKEYKDRTEIKPNAIYQALRDGKSPKTSQVSPETFEHVFRSYAEANHPLLYITFSSELSGTYQTAKMMEQTVKTDFPDAPIRVIDSKCASLGLGIVVLHAAKLAKEGVSLEEITQAAEDHAAHIEHIFTVNDLEYLHRGGRIGKTTAFVGSILNIKPLLHVEEGKLIPIEKIRGSKKLFKRMLDLMDERNHNLQETTIAICHGDDPERARELADLVKERFHIDEKNIMIEMIGSVIGSHVGPGTIGLFFLNK